MSRPLSRSRHRSLPAQRGAAGPSASGASGDPLEAGPGAGAGLLAPDAWGPLARAAGIAPDERLLVALSGGADSVLLLHLAAAALPRPALRAVHVDHGLRGAAGRRDASFCERLCRSLDVPFARRELRLDPSLPSLEARAREARYRALAAEARESGHPTLLTGHHRDDVLETLLLRWMRGGAAPGWKGPRRTTVLPVTLPAGRGGLPERVLLRVVRPLASYRRAEVRRILAEHGLAWCEDASNRDPRHSRTRVRHGLLPRLERWCGPDALDGLRAFADAVERLEDELAAATAPLDWSTSEVGRVRVLPRAELMRLARPLRRRVLWRLLTHGTSRSPGRALLERLLDDLDAARCARHTLPGAWHLVLRSDELQLVPPELADASPVSAARAGGGERPSVELCVPGSVCLLDGRRISARLVEAEPGEPFPRSPYEVEMDADGLPARLAVRLPSSGDRFHALGAPGSKRLSRYLADRGLAREERANVPLVLADQEIIWVPGFAPAEARRVRPETCRRVRLALERDDDAPSL